MSSKKIREVKSALRTLLRLLSCIAIAIKENILTARATDGDNPANKTNPHSKKIRSIVLRGFP